VSTLTASPGAAGLFARSWWVLFFRGLLALVLGLLVFTRPALTLSVVVLAFGAYALVEGLASLIAAIRGRTHSDDRWLLLLEAGIGIAIGIVTLRTPGITATVLIFFIAIWALATGVIRIVEGVRLRHEITGEVWLILGGLASVAFALMVMLQPLAGALVLVRVIGAYALILGATEVLLAFRLRSARRIEQSGAWDPTRRRAA
jgi:uncharacterized membrane protein HdeD (DUF308 family)